MILSKLLPNEIDKMDYNNLIGLVQETNRPPGGIRSVIEIAVHSFLTPGKRVLEIGTSTGFTAIELSQLTGSQVTAIDTNEHSLSIAKERSAKMQIDNKITFELQDATDLSYPNNFFDLVFCGNVNSLISDRSKALSEYIRVLKEGGILAAIPMYYVNAPPCKIIEEVGKTINFKITPMYRNEWLNFYDVSTLQMFWYRDYKFDQISTTEVESYAEYLLNKPHLKSLKPETFKTLYKKYMDYMLLFRENLTYMGYTILLLRKERGFFEPELFTGHEL